MDSGYENTKSMLMVRCFNAGTYNTLLDSILYRQIGDVLIAPLTVCNGECAWISRNFPDLMGISAGQVIDDALANCSAITPPRIYLYGRMDEPDYKGENFMEEGCMLMPDGVCLATTEKTYGAAAIFFPGVAERLANLNRSGLYFGFLSEHEAVVHSDTEDLNGIKENLILSTEEFLKRGMLLPDQVLSRNTFHYDPETKNFTVC